MLKKILDKKQPTEKVGKSPENSSQEKELVSYIVVQNADGEEVIELKNRVTIGSEVGDLILTDEKVSPRHCTFFCNKGVYSLIDHASKHGTHINKRKIESNKVYLLDEKDKFRIGKLQLEIALRERIVDPDLIEKVVTQEIAPDEESDDTRELSPELLKKLAVENESQKSSKVVDLELEDEEPEEVFTDTEIREINENALKQETLVSKKMPVIPIKESLAQDDTEKLELSKTNKKKKPKKEKKKSTVKVSRDSSSSALTRLISFVNDVVITYIVVEVFSVFSEFKNIYTMLPEEIFQNLKPLIVPQLELLAKMYPSLNDLSVQVNGLPKTKEAFEFLTFLFLLKITSSLVFSLSLGQILAGMRVEGNFLWKRIIAPIRIILGGLLFPFLIFDLPTIFSKRSFKEVITRTQYMTRGGIISVLAKLFVTPILLLMAMLSPLYQGFEELAPVTINQSTKVMPPYNYQRPVYIEALDLTFEDMAPVKILPLLALQMKNKKEILRSGVLIMDTETGASYEIKKLKSFSFQEFFESFVNKNPASPQFQPEIYGLVKNVANNNKNFDLKVKNKNKLVAEVTKLVKDSFEVSLQKLPDFVLDNGIFISAYRDFREKLISLYDSPPEKIQIMNLGNVTGIFASHGQGPMRYHTFIPLGEIEGVMYEIVGNFNSPKLNKLKSQMRFGDKSKQESPPSIAAYINLSHEGLIKDKLILNQEVYLRYFVASQALLAKSDFKNIEIIKKSLNQFINILNLDDKSNQKLTQNLTELLQALKTENKEFFSITETEVI